MYQTNEIPRSFGKRENIPHTHIIHSTTYINITMSAYINTVINFPNKKLINRKWNDVRCEFINCCGWWWWRNTRTLISMLFKLWIRASVGIGTYRFELEISAKKYSQIIRGVGRHLWPTKIIPMSLFRSYIKYINTNKKIPPKSRKKKHKHKILITHNTTLESSII